MTESNSLPNCPDCLVPMEWGALLDYNHAQVRTVNWHVGDPPLSKFLGFANGVRPVAAKTFPTTACRCPNCGVLRLYAGLPQIPTDFGDPA